MDKARAELGRDLAHAVRTGPFSAVLHLAIEDRGMRLEEIQERLAAAGVPISLTMLNYWRRGRSQPERPESIKAVDLVVEYEFRVDSSYFTDNFYRGFSVPIGEYLLQIQFDADAVPAKCYRFERHSISAPDQGVREVWIGSTQGAHLLACEMPPGVVGMRWEWQ